MADSGGRTSPAFARHDVDGDDSVKQQDPSQTVLAALESQAVHEYLEDDKGQRDDTLPDWFDEERYRRGTEVFEKHIFLMFSGKMTGLLTLLAIPSIVEVLVLTKQSGEGHKAFRRYVDTIRHMLFWYRTDVKDPKSPCRESLNVVRNHHLRGSAAARRAKHPGISQFDLVLTQFAFCGYVMLRRDQLHLNACDQDVLDFCHVWRTLGYLIGVHDRYNVCQFDTDIANTDKLLEGVCMKWLAPALASPPEEFDSMSHALLDGAWCMMPVIEYTSFLHFTQELAGVPHQQRCQPSKTYSSMMLAFLHLVPNSMSWPILGRVLRIYHNTNMRFSIYMSTYYPLLAWYAYPGNPSTKYHKLIPSEK